MATRGILKCSDELLLHIFSYFDPVSLSKENVSSRELYNTALTCRRFYRVALPLLYQEIRFDYNSLLGQDRFAVDAFIRTLDTQQERAAWVQSAHLSWHEDETRMWSDITNLCSTLHSIHTLDLRIVVPESDSARRPWVGRPARDRCFAQFLRKWAHLNALRKVHVEDPRITIEDILSFAYLPKLDRLTVWGFGRLVYNLEPFLHTQSNLTKLEFRKVGQMPSPGVMELLLQNYPRLEELTWELRNNWHYGWQPSSVNEALRPLHSNLVKLEISNSTTDTGEFYYLGNSQMDFSKFTSLKFIKVYDRMMFARREDEDVPLDCYRNCYKRLPVSLVEFEVTFDSSTCAIRPGGKAEIDYSWILNLANQKSDNLRSLSKVTILEAGHLAGEEDEYLRSYLSGEENATLKQELQIYPREWNYPEEVKLAFGQAGVSLIVATTGSAHLCDGTDHFWYGSDYSDGSV